MGPGRHRAWATAATLLLLAACGVPAPPGEPAPPRMPGAAPVSPSPSVVASATVRPTSTPTPVPTPTPASPQRPAPEAVLASDCRPRDAWLTISRLGLEGLRVRTYRGAPDDARGTRIQDAGLLASPSGPRGGTGVGGIGNYLVTGHRTSSTEPFRRLPRLRNGDRVHVVAAGRRYTYRIVDTRITSFRSPRSLARQRAAVPGRPGVRATAAMITLSTCRTPEDRAEGNTWTDRFGNPENRIDKIGVLVAVENA